MDKPREAEDSRLMDQGAAKIGVGLRGQGLLDKLPSLVWTQSPEGTIDVVNRTWREYTGLDIEESGGFDWSSIVHPEDTPTLREKLNSDRASELVNAQVRLRRADGEFKWFQLQANAVPNPKKAYQNWAIVAIDIHDQKIREDAIRSAENNFRLIVESIPIPVAVTTPTGEVEALNKLTLDYFGRTFEELKAWKASDVVHPDDLEATIRSQIESHESGNAYNVQSRHLRHDGVYRWFNVIGLPLKDEEDRILRWFHLQVDIEDQKRAEYALRTHEHNLKLIIDTTPALAWSAGSNGRLDYFNKHSLDYLGMSEEEAIAGAWTDAVHPDDEHNLASTWKRILTSERPGEAEFRLRRHDGEYRWFLLRANPLFDGTGTVLRWYGVNTDIQDRKESEARLQESEQRFRTLFEEAGAGITLLELDPVSPIRTNRAMQSMLGCAGEELSTVEMFTAMTAEENREQDLDLFVELRQGKRDTLRQEKHFILKDGSSVWANGIFTLLRDPNGNPKSVISIHEDVTERKLALEKLQAYQDLLELAQKSAGAMAFDWYVKKEINYWSPEQEALFGLKPGTFDGTFKSWKKMMYQPDWPVVVEAIKRAEKTGEVEAEYRVIWPDGSLHWLATNGRMFFDDSGEPLRMVGFTSDVTRRKLAEEELRRSEAFLAEGQYLARLGNFSWNVETEEILWSEQLYRTFAFDLEEPVTLDLIATRVHPDDMGLLYDMVDRARRGASDFEYEHRLLLPDNSVKYVHLIAHRTPDDAKLEYIGAVQDVTQRRLSEEALSEARSELARVARAMSLGVLTASIAHEVNQPLSGIITNASTCVRMLDADPPNVDGARETARRTIRDGNRASEVITRLRSLFGRKEATFESLDLNEATREVIALTASDLRRNNVVLETHFSPNLPLVNGDRVQLQQVILNLIRNAMDAMDTVDGRLKRLSIATQRDAAQVMVSICDSGIGLDAHSTSRLFDAFFTTKEEGMGIGLSVSKSIIENHKGCLWATPNDGPGSTFSFALTYVQTTDLTENEDSNSIYLDRQKRKTKD